MATRRNFLWFGWSLLIPLAFQPVATAAPPAPLRILLLGDSSVQGSVCRKMHPKADHLEDVIRKRLAAEPNLPPTEVVNQGLDGEYVRGLLDNRYDRQIKPLGRFNLILIRYGINDRARREDFAKNFSQDYSELIARLRMDNPGSRIIVETAIPFGNPEYEQQINKIIREVAQTENVPLLDTFKIFEEALRRNGQNALTYRRVKISSIPENLRELLPPETMEVIRNEVVVMDNSLDAHFRQVPRWFADRHPNLAGYHELGEGIAEYLISTLRN